ncbi:MAG TPA: methylated-DNA--[protein]-cysteine S-methyltransferase [Ilumatobacteraceae bacterium]|nr:methylated-DNA--[protein]-cysteine S-methyltransferase [Ilumatobacteraceae bacterium]
MNDTTTKRYRTTMPSPVGELTLVTDDLALRTISFPPGAHPSRDATPDVDRDVVDVAAGDHPLLAFAQRQLEEYFAGTRVEFDLPLAPEGTPFQQQAWSVLRSIPFGATMSYGQQAAQLGDRRRARAVGAANGRNPIPIVVPCHRVVGANGHLTGFGGGIGAKAWLLDHERLVSFAQ